MDTDNQLLGNYAKTGSERAFRELVERRISLVHSAALRESGGDSSFAEDITQAVFTELARNADALADHPALSGWLYTCVRRMCASVRRSEHRRQRREQEVYIMNRLLESDPTDNLWQQVRPLLDDVMHEMSEDDRTAVVLRFFEGRSLKEIGLVLGLSENAARMRVERSLEKLRSSLSQRGVKSTTTTLAGVLAVGAVMTAPLTLASTVTLGAMTAANSSSVGASAIATLLKLTKPKTAMVGASMAFIAALFTWQHFRSIQAVPQQTIQTEVATSQMASAANGPASQENSDIPLTGATNLTSSAMTLQVVETETGNPLPDTKLYLFYLFEDGRGKHVRATTDANGRLKVAMLETPFHGLNLFVTADGHVPKVTTFGFGRVMPSEYIMKLERGVTIGGVVVDEAGQPVTGAKIEFDGPGSDMTLQENIQFGPDTAVVTDVNGRWSCNLIAREFSEISLVVTHPEHAETKTTIHPQVPEATNSIITMVAGFSVAGKVQDSNGNPVEGAKVRELRQNSEGEHSEMTDPTGAFEFKNMKTGELMLSVQAKGFAPAVQSLRITGNLASIQFTLGPGQLLRGRLIDESGHPLTNAFAETTRLDFDKFKWSTNTDSEGRFEWDSAPHEPVAYSFLAEGFNRVYALKLEADGSEHEIKLTRDQPGKDTIQITGTVQDADTSQPLDGFKVLVGRVDPDWVEKYRFLTSGKDGRFTVSQSTNSLHTKYQLQIEKEGYVPAISAELSMKDGNQALEFQMRKGSGPSGVVLLPSGEPAAEATVFLCVPQAGVTITGPAQVKKGINTTSYFTRTDRAGTFSLPAVIDPQGLVVVHDQGYTQVSPSELGKGLTITLQPWGRIEGSVVLDSQPVPNDQVVVYGHEFRYDEKGRRVGLMSFSFGITTDSMGKFVFEKLPPGQISVYRHKILARDAAFESHETWVDVKAGTTTRVILGGSGRPVIGTVVVPGGDDSIPWQSVPVHLRLKLANELGPRPRRHEFSSNESFILMMNQWDQAVRARREFGTFCDATGSFRLQDIPAGLYELEIKVLDFKASAEVRGPSERAPEIGSVRREIVVPEGQAGDALDLGALELFPPQASASGR
jgi:RNA polymerase sigma factor (sigma-70 family)